MSRRADVGTSRCGGLEFREPRFCFCGFVGFRQKENAAVTTATGQQRRCFDWIKMLGLEFCLRGTRSDMIG
jgi:hypothetical protein